MQDTGLPGSPKTGLPSHIARMVGLPGRMATPCTKTPGGPSLLMAFGGQIAVADRAARP